MSSYNLPYGRQSIDADDIAAVADALKRPMLTTGPLVEEFERAVAAAVGCSHAVAVNSGTAALHAAYSAMGVGPGSEVITSPLTFASTANAALHLGATVKFADVELSTGLLDPAAVEATVSPSTTLIVPVDFAGAPADYGSLRRIATNCGARVAGDSAHSLGASRDGVRVGSLCDAATISLHPVKTITTGEGGLVLTNDEALAKDMRRFRHHGIERDGAHALAHEGPWAYSMVDLGLNYRLTDFQCALGISQLSKLERFLNRRREIAAFYDRELQAVQGISTPVTPASVENAWHLYVIHVEEPSRRRDFFDSLRAAGLGVQVHYIPVYWHPFYRDLGYVKGQCPNAEQFYSSAISIPLFPTMTDRDCASVVERIHDAARAVL